MEVEVNGKKWIVDDDRAQITKKYFNDEDFQTMRVLHFRNLTKWQRQSFEFIIQNTSSYSRKEKKEDKSRK